MSTLQEPLLTTTSPTQEATVSKTRSGRVVKAPQRYAPQEVCDDDYQADDYDSHESETVSSEVSYDSEDISSESDADNNGNLKGFVVESETSEDVDGSDIQSDSSETDVSVAERPTRKPREPARRRAAPDGAKRTLVL